MVHYQKTKWPALAVGRRAAGTAASHLYILRSAMTVYVVNHYSCGVLGWGMGDREGCVLFQMHLVVEDSEAEEAVGG